MFWKLDVLHIWCWLCPLDYSHCPPPVENHASLSYRCPLYHSQYFPYIVFPPSRKCAPRTASIQACQTRIFLHNFNNAIRWLEMRVDDVVTLNQSAPHFRHRISEHEPKNNDK